MKTIVALALCLTSFVAAASEMRAPLDPPFARELEFWIERAKQVHVGMRRADVERLLPQYNPEQYDYRYALGGGAISGGTQSLAYCVGPGFLVSVSYDYTGVPRDPNGKASGTFSSENRVIAPVRVEYRPKPLVKDLQEAEAEYKRALAERRKAANQRVDPASGPARRISGSQSQD